MSMTKFLDPCNDVAFKKVFGSENHKRVTISFLNSILEYTGDKTIIDVQFGNTEQNPLISAKKETYLDIYCTDQASRRYIVEMQARRVQEFGKRIVFYGAKTYAMQLDEGTPYTKLNPVIALSIVDFNLFSEKKDYKSIHKIMDIKTHENDLTDLSFAFIELKKFTKQEHELVTAQDKWIYFIKKITEQDHIPAPLATGEFQEACRVVERMTWNQDEIIAYDKAFIEATSEQGEIELAREEGKAEGEKKGEKKKTIEIALRLLNAKLDIKTIALTTGLTIDEINELDKKN